MYNYTLMYYNQALTKDVIALMKENKQNIEEIEILTIYADSAVGFKIKLSHSATTKAEEGRVRFLHHIKAFYDGNDVWIVEL